MSNEQQSTDPDLAIFAGNSPSLETPSTRHAGRKRKGPSLSDTPSQGVNNSPGQSSHYRRLAKRPSLIGQPSSSGSTGLSLVLCPWRSHLERITSLAVAISRISRIAKSALIPQHYELDMEPLLQQSENLQQSYLELRECLQQSTPALVTCPWRSHLERINSLAVAISQISRDFSSIQLLPDVDVEALSQQSMYLQQSYFKLQEFVQSSVPSFGGSTLGMSELGRNYN
ncbi:hypothetical protein L211DRAFT_852952 [Terfezia boudieri ATCC MYA-4762]|uniref:Uncharacterized protein n=1 Tax=Terfezia boudieri ATCC MYA-4762 TaxID=1051890 RepID=A0A3N4LA65_9PEZI|nr:hypothetical protein L211DRAFT_852952 [Terfezia boudieri ATCC MYA-4762]